MKIIIRLVELITIAFLIALFLYGFELSIRIYTNYVMEISFWEGVAQCQQQRTAYEEPPLMDTGHTNKDGSTN